MLRRLFSIGALISLCCTTAFGQVAVGVKGSLQLAKLRISPDDELSEILVGFQAGLLVDAPITDRLSIRPQLLYSVKGGKQTLTYQGGVSEIKITINYLEVPVQLAYGFDAGEGNVVIGAGPYLGYALNGTAAGTETRNGRTQTEKENLTFDNADGLKRIDVGLHISAGYELPSGLMVAGYYSPGLTSIDRSATQSAKTAAFGLSVGYFFNRR